MEKDYKKSTWVDGSEPDIDALHLNNIEDGIDGLYKPVFDDGGEVADVTDFPSFLAKVVSGMNPITFYKNFKAGMAFVLHAGRLVNNGLCNIPGKYPLDAAYGKALLDMIGNVSELPGGAADVVAAITKQNSDLAGYYKLSGGVSIPEGADLFTYKTPGSYYCTSNDKAETLLNCPTRFAFVLKAEYSTGNDYPSLCIREYNTGKLYYAYYVPEQSRWIPWKYSIQSPDFKSAVIGSVTNGNNQLRLQVEKYANNNLYLVAYNNDTNASLGAIQLGK